MSHQEAVHVVPAGAEQVGAVLHDVDGWPRFVPGLAGVRRTSHARYLFRMSGAGHDVQVPVAVAFRAGRAVWRAVEGPRYVGEFRWRAAGDGLTEVQLSLTAPPVGALEALEEMLGTGLDAGLASYALMRLHDVCTGHHAADTVPGRTV